MNIKFKILQVYPQDKSIQVHYYTDELVAAMQPIWDKRTAQLLVENPSYTEQMAMAQAMDERPAGTKLWVTLYPDPVPTGQALLDYIYSYAPGDWLVTVSNAAVTPDPLTSIVNTIDTEYTMTITAQIAPTMMSTRTATPASPTTSGSTGAVVLTPTIA